MLQFSENRAPVSRIITKEVEGSGVCDETHFYQPDDSKVTGRLLREISNLTFVDVLKMTGGTPEVRSDKS